MTSKGLGQAVVHMVTGVQHEAAIWYMCTAGDRLREEAGIAGIGQEDDKGHNRTRGHSGTGCEIAGIYRVHGG